MKAWHCFDPCIGEADLLVFAETRGRARILAVENATWEYGDFINVGCVRAKKYDKFCENDERIFDTNEDLPEGAPPFYSDEEYIP